MHIGYAQGMKPAGEIAQQRFDLSPEPASGTVDGVARAAWLRRLLAPGRFGSVEQVGVPHRL
jgi:hypothetical protein